MTPSSSVSPGSGSSPDLICLFNRFQEGVGTFLKEECGYTLGLKKKDIVWQELLEASESNRQALGIFDAAITYHHISLDGLSKDFPKTAKSCEEIFKEAREQQKSDFKNDRRNYYYIPFLYCQSTPFKNPLTMGDFCPWNSWEKDGGAIVDKTTGYMYGSEPTMLSRFKCFLVALGTPFFHTLSVIVNIVYRVLKILSFHDYWGSNKSFKACLIEQGKDFFRIVAAPLVLVALELSAIYGLVCPREGKKLYASFDRLMFYHIVDYNGFLPVHFAPCFQPYAKGHGLGGIRFWGGQL